LLNNIGQKYAVIQVEKSNGNQKYFQVGQKQKISENRIIHNQFKENEDHPDYEMVDVYGFYPFQKRFHVRCLFFFFKGQNSSNENIEGIIAH